MRCYKDHEFCEDQECFYFREKKCIVKGCCFTVKEFHKWLNKNFFRIIKG